jgi:hypothetical protein
MLLAATLRLTNSQAIQVFHFHIALSKKEEGGQFLCSNHSLDRRFEFPFGIESLQFGQVSSQIHAREHIVGNSHPLVLQGLFGRQTLFRIYSEQCSDQVLGIVRDWVPEFFVKGVVSLTNFLEEQVLALFFKGTVSTEQNVDNNTQTPHVALRIVRQALQNLGCDVPRCPAHGAQA